jgi:hypothetical protein
MTMGENDVETAVRAVYEGAANINRAADDLESLTSIQKKAADASRQLSTASGLTSKELSAAGKNAGLTAGEIRKLVQSEQLSTDEAKKMAAAQQEADAKLKGLKQSSAETADSLDKLVIGLEAAAGAAIIGTGFNLLGEAMGGVIQQGEEAEQTMAQTQAAIASTGGASGITAGQVSNLADRLSTLSGIDDEVIQNAQNMALKFTSISSDVFPRFSQAALDLGVRLGKDLPEAFDLVGRSINAPLQAEARLRKQGIDLSDSTQTLIKNMMAMGDVAGAQNAILSELEIRFGGAAQTAGSTATGAINQFNVTLGNSEEVIGKEVLPALGDLARAAGPAMKAAIDDSKPAIVSFVDTLLQIPTKTLEAGNAQREMKVELASSSHSAEEYARRLQAAGVIQQYLTDATHNGDLTTRTASGAVIDLTEEYGKLNAAFQEGLVERDEEMRHLHGISGRIERQPPARRI